jgi:hypothetical protein
MSSLSMAGIVESYPGRNVDLLDVLVMSPRNSLTDGPFVRELRR